MNRIPFVDLKAQYASIKHEILPAMEEVLETSAFVLGPSVSEFERSFAAAHDVRYVFGTGSGTDGNHMALWVLGIGPGDEVIIPANTFIATAWGATLCGATPVFADVNPETFTLDPEDLERRITPRTRAVVAVHLYGQPADLKSVMAITNDHRIHLVEDCAQAHLAEFNGKRVGGMGVTSSFSFYPGKNLGAYGEGGAVATNDPNLANSMKLIRDHGSNRKYYHEIYGHNYRMDGIQGAVLNTKMKHIEAWTEARRRHASRYAKGLGQISGICIPVEAPYSHHVYHLYVVKAEKRDQLQKYLEEKGIATGLHYPVPLHRQRAFSHLGYSQGDFPVAERISDEILSLPMYAELTDEQIDYVCETIREFYG